MQTFRNIVEAAVLVNALTTVLVLNKVIHVPHFDYRFSTLLVVGTLVALNTLSPAPKVRHAA